MVYVCKMKFEIQNLGIYEKRYILCWDNFPKMDTKSNIISFRDHYLCFQISYRNGSVFDRKLWISVFKKIWSKPYWRSIDRAIEQNPFAFLLGHPVVIFRICTKNIKRMCNYERKFLPLTENSQIFNDNFTFSLF